MPSKVFTERMTINCTPEQKAALQKARAKAGDDHSDNQFFISLLAEYCASQGVEWPTVELKTEGKAKSKWKIGEGGKFVKP